MRPQDAVRIHEIHADHGLTVILPRRPLAPDYERAFEMMHQAFGQIRGAAGNQHLQLSIARLRIPKNELTVAGYFVEHFLAGCLIVDLHVQVLTEVQGDTASAAEHIEDTLQHRLACYEEPSSCASRSGPPLKDDDLPPFCSEPPGERLVLP
jgi:hypothetical protein